MSGQIINLSLYRRHTSACPHRTKGQNYTKCSCPIWCDGELNGRRFRKSVGLRDWARAVKRIEKWETAPAKATKDYTLAGAIESYLGDCRARRLKTSTITSYRKTLDHLLAFCESRSRLNIASLDLALLTDFRAGRTVAPKTEGEPHCQISPSTSGKELETLRAFCAFALKRGWIDSNFAKDLDAPLEDGPPTLPFTGDEVNRILEACGKWGDKNPNTREQTRAKARGLVLVMLYSGLRISDVVQLRRRAVDLTTGKLLLRVMKTGAPLYVRLGEPAMDALKALPEKGEYFFWNGTSALSTAIGLARRTIARLLVNAGVDGHPHRFRDTFSVELLSKGEELRTVQLLLGHTSIKTTEKHYAPYVESFQRILDAATAKLDFGHVKAIGREDSGTKSGTVQKLSHKLLKIG